MRSASWFYLGKLHNLSKVSYHKVMELGFHLCGFYALHFPLLVALSLNLQIWWALGFSGGSDVKESACNVGDPTSIPGSGRSPGEGIGSPLQYSCLENSRDRGTWWATVHGAAKSWTRITLSLVCTYILSYFATHFSLVQTVKHARLMPLPYSVWTTLCARHGNRMVRNMAPGWWNHRLCLNILS